MFIFHKLLFINQIYKISFLLFGMCSQVYLQGQTIFWSENFGSGCNTGNTATTFGWNISSTGTNLSGANLWYVSAAENGNGDGNCGSGCGADPTLHISAAPSTGGDVGAAYAESDPGTCSFFAICTETNKRAESPIINCSGYAGITLSFEYIEFGDGSNDNATLWYYDGSTWLQLADMPKTNCCGGICDGSRQARWALYSITLPASADNNPNVRIGFNWTDNMDGVAADPSVGIDNVELSVATLPIELISFAAECKNPGIELKWKTASETNNDFFTIEKSSDTKSWKTKDIIDGDGNSSDLNSYSYLDHNKSNKPCYYRLKQTDFDGKYNYSDIIAVEPCKINRGIDIYPNPAGTKVSFSYSDPEILNRVKSVFIYNMVGEMVYESSSLPSGIETSGWSKGGYLVHINMQTEVFSRKFILGR